MAKDINISCKSGSIRISDYVLRLHSMTGKPIWQIPVQMVTGIEEVSRKIMSTAVIHTTQEDRTIEWLSPTDIPKLQQALLDWQANAPALQEIPPMYQQAFAPQSTPAPSAPGAQPTPEKKQKPRWLQDWWEDDTKLTHVATYTKQKDMQRELETAYRHGWMIQGQSAQGGKSSAGRVIGGALIAGPIGALAGAASKSKDKTTITYVRTSEWLENHRR